MKVTNQRGQLGHLQAELVSPLWPLKAEIKGRAEDMTVQLLKEVLREMGVHFTQSCRKAELINELMAARKQANQTTVDSIREYCEATINSNNNRAIEAVVDDGGRPYSTNRPGNEHTTENISGFVFRYPVYYFDAKIDCGICSFTFPFRDHRNLPRPSHLSPSYFPVAACSSIYFFGLFSLRHLVPERNRTFAVVFHK